ncbi:Protein of unknown function [Paracoccus isoporae]|uniref:Glycosyltransferase 61 catalytic domain-containing protein n=1 Tax=Paracoccus isoporae TaxID=591205 RepID=A0A1G6UKV1_9RHOB|nr:glycosyltransferase family 61 protein [Paracoccus isoporae]SDD41909.1 Protein of unknown function [Paracoccus isoporae]
MSFDPTQSLAGDIRTVESALIVPFAPGKTRGLRRPSGVFDASGSYLPLGQCFRNSTTPVTVEPTEETPQIAEETLNGTWLFGGMLYGHFGHFLVESTARLWAIPHVRDKLDGVIFLTKKQVTWPRRFVRPLLPLLEMFGPPCANSEGAVRPTRVERLVLAPQGFGTGDMIGGCPEYRQFVRAHFGRDIAPAGAEKIYISRSRLFSKRGRYLGEAALERMFAAEGYRIFHPQDLPISEQIAQYKAARVIVSSDNSALHLAGFYTGPEVRVGIILRRPGGIVADFMRQFRHFAGRAPVVIDALSGRQYQFESADRRQVSEIYAELDFPRLTAALHDHGFLQQSHGAAFPGRVEMDAEVATLSERLGQAVVPVEMP